MNLKKFVKSINEAYVDEPGDFSEVNEVATEISQTVDELLDLTSRIDVQWANTEYRQSASVNNLIKLSGQLEKISKQMSKLLSDYKKL
jgi:hypothetical protein